MRRAYGRKRRAIQLNWMGDDMSLQSTTNFPNSQTLPALKFSNNTSCEGEMALQCIHYRTLPHHIPSTPPSHLPQTAPNIHPLPDSEATPQPPTTTCLLHCPPIYISTIDNNMTGLVMVIPKTDYTSSTALMQPSSSGWLVTCANLPHTTLPDVVTSPSSDTFT